MWGKKSWGLLVPWVENAPIFSDLNLVIGFHPASSDHEIDWQFFGLTLQSHTRTLQRTSLAACCSHGKIPGSCANSAVSTWNFGEKFGSSRVCNLCLCVSSQFPHNFDLNNSGCKGQHVAAWQDTLLASLTLWRAMLEERIMHCEFGHKKRMLRSSSDL